MKTLSTLVVLVVVLVASASAGHKCKYERQGKWSECENGKQTVTKVRQEGSDESCPPQKVKTRICVAGEKCKYEKNDWSECNEATNQQTRTMTLKTGKSLCSPEKTITRKCKKVSGCRYEHNTHYSHCNETTYTQSRVLKLKKALKGHTCEEELKDTIPCKGKCKYSQDAYGECDPKTGTKNRLNRLISGNKDMCDPEKTQTKKCIPGKHKHGHKKHGGHGKHGGENTGGENM